MEKETKMDGTVEDLAIVSDSQPSMDIVPTPAPIPLAIPLKTAFWTSCTKCGLGLEYPMVYRNSLLRCPHCHKPFEAKEKSLVSIIGQTDSSVPPAPNEVAAKCMEALPSTQSSSGPKIYQYQSHHAVTRRGVLLGPKNGSIMQARHKRQRKDLSVVPFAADYKVSTDASFEEPLVPEIQNDARFEMPRMLPEIQHKASPEEVVAELEPIRHDLTSMEWIKSFNMLRYNGFQFNSLKAVPMELRKEWLLNEIK